MKRRWMLAVLSAVVLIGLGILMVGPSRVASSSLSKGPSGWLGARLLLEQSGAEPVVYENPEVAVGAEGLLVETFPWPLSESRHADRLERVVAHRAAGGDLLLAYSGRENSGEISFFETLGLEIQPVRRSIPPLSYGAWKRYQEEVWPLEPVETFGTGNLATVTSLELPAPTWGPAPPDNAEVLYRGPGGEALVFLLGDRAGDGDGRRGGRTLVVPASLFSNSGLWRRDNAAFLRVLAEAFPQNWFFDEQGLGAQDPDTLAAQEHYRRVFTWFGIHLLVLYLLGILALGRRFGPPWREAPVLVGSTGAFLRALGQLHRQSGHHRAAARALADRSDEMFEGRSVPDPWRDEAATVDAQGFLKLSRRLARWRRRKS